MFITPAWTRSAWAWGRGDDIVGDALDHHFGACEAGEVTGDVELNGGWHGGLGFLDFREVFDVGQAVEIGVLGPQRGFMGEGCGVDDGIRHGEFVVHAQGCS